MLLSRGIQGVVNIAVIITLMATFILGITMVNFKVFLGGKSE